MPGRYDHIDFTPPQGARDAAESALRVRAEKPESERGMTAVGIARARDLIAGKTLSPKTVRRMLAYFQRHESDKRGATWDERGKGWQAWNGWGGDAGYAWARKVVRQMDAADEKSSSMSDQTIDTTEHADEHVADDSVGEDVTSITTRCDAVALVFADGGVASVGHSTWNQIARVGPMHGHPQGRAEFTKENLAEIVANHAATKNGEVPGDFEHFSERPPPEAAITGVPAPFWVRKIELRNGGTELWALFTWVDANAVKMVRAGQYKYVSPAVQFNARDRATGKPIGARLTSVALTNHPFIDGMAPLTASSRDAIAVAVRVHFAEALHAMGVADAHAATDEDVLAVLATTRAFTPSPDSLHVPTTGASQPEKSMEEEMKDKPPAAVMAEPGDKGALQEMKRDADKDMMAKYSAAMRRMATVCGMADFAPDAEGAEDSLIAQMEQIVSALKASQEREKAAMSAASAQMADRVIAAGLADAAAREDLVALHMSDAARFGRLYPASRIDAPKSIEQPKGVEPKSVAVLTSAFTGRDEKPHATTTGADTFSSQRDSRAVEIMKRDGIDLFTATVRAEAELRGAARAS